MPEFRYKALDADGRFVSGALDAPDPREAEARLRSLGYVPLEAVGGAAPADDRRGSFAGLFQRPVNRREVTTFLSELALVLRAGLVLDEALQLLAGEERPALAAIALDLRARIAGGASLADAMQAHPRAFGPDIVATVRVAEASGNLDAVLASVAAERAKVERMLDKVSASLRYPAFLFVVAAAVLVFFLVAVVPQFGAVIRDYDSSPGGFVVAVLGISDWLIVNGPLLLGVVGASVLLAYLALRRPEVRRRALGRVARLPGLRGILHLRRTVLFCGHLGTLLANGVVLTEALRVMLQMPGAEAGGLERVVEGVRRGGRLVEALSRTNYLPPIALKMLRVGEESGELAAVAQRTAEFYEAKLTDRLERVVGVIGPAAIIFIAAVVGGLIISILSALLSVNQLVL